MNTIQPNLPSTPVYPVAAKSPAAPPPAAQVAAKAPDAAAAVEIDLGKLIADQQQVDTSKQAASGFDVKSLNFESVASKTLERIQLLGRPDASQPVTLRIGHHRIEIPAAKLNKETLVKLLSDTFSRMSPADLNQALELAKASKPLIDQIRAAKPEAAAPVQVPAELKTKEEIAACLKAQGLPEADLATTFTYLEKLGADYAEIGTLVVNQLKCGRDANDVLGAIQAYGVLLEGQKMNISGTETEHFKEVMAGLKDGRVRVDKDATIDMKGAYAIYRYKEDIIFLPKTFSIESAYERSVMFHELFHTIQDVEHKKKDIKNMPLFKASEFEAYVAQAVFLINSGFKPDQGELKDQEILNPAVNLVLAQNEEKELKTQSPPNQAKLAAMEQKITDLKALLAEKVKEYYYAKAELPIPANGLEHHHRH